MEAFDELLGDKILLDDVDMVVLATGMVPATAFGEDFKAKSRKTRRKKMKWSPPSTPSLSRTS